MTRVSVVAPPIRDEIWYPETDEETVGETDFHMLALIWLRQALEDWFAAQDTVYIASDLYLYFTEGDPTRKRAPDVMVVKGVSRRHRRVFLTWKERAVPCTVFEIVSERSVAEDTGPKMVDYASIGVKEYFLFDPEGRYLKPLLQGYRLRGREYVRLAPAADGTFTSRELGLRLRAECPMLRLLDARTGEAILTRDERAEREREQKEQEREQKEQEREQKEQEREQKEQEREQKEQEREQKEQEREQKERERALKEQEQRRAEQERAQKELERRRADALAKENEQLRAELARLRAEKKPTRHGKKQN